MAYECLPICRCTLSPETSPLSLVKFARSSNAQSSSIGYLAYRVHFRICFYFVAPTVVVLYKGSQRLNDIIYQPWELLGSRTSV